MFDPSQYKIHVFSLHPSLVGQNDLSKAEAKSAVLSLEKEWDNEKRMGSNFDVEETEAEFERQLREDDAVFILAKKISSGEFVGFTSVINEEHIGMKRMPTLSEVFVMEGNKGKGVATGMVERGIQIARGVFEYPYLYTEPNDVSRKLMENLNFVPAGEKMMRLRLERPAREIPSPGNEGPGLRQ